MSSGRWVWIGLLLALADSAARGVGPAARAAWRVDRCRSRPRHVVVIWATWSPAARGASTASMHSKGLAHVVAVKFQEAEIKKLSAQGAPDAGVCSTGTESSRNHSPWPLPGLVVYQDGRFSCGAPARGSGRILQDLLR